MSANVVIMVLDTLRKDSSEGLDSLLDIGFRKYENAIAPATWTLPSHVAMFTGDLPSAHGVHESREMRVSDLIGPSRERLSRSSIITYLGDMGYTTYGASANPQISPGFGFRFDHYFEFDYTGEVRGVQRTLSPERNFSMNSKLLLRSHSFGTIGRLAYFRVLEMVMTSLGRQQLEKGSRSMLDRLSRTELQSPFFFFANLMEAHNPYKWGEDDLRLFVTSVLGRADRSHKWEQMYPAHANLAISRANALARHLMRYDPLIIVVSDHGQMLGERGHYSHGYFLDEALAEVPFYVRFPTAWNGSQVVGQCLSTIDIPKIIDGVIRKSDIRIGNDLAFSESFGCQNSLEPYMLKEDKPRLPEIYSHRTRVFTKQGSFIYNCDTKVVEEVSDSFPESRIPDLIRRIPKGDAGTSWSKSRPSGEDELGILERLKHLGYE